MSTGDRPTETDALFQQAVAAHRAGRLDAAAAGYRQVLAANESQADAWHLLGLIQLQQGRPGDAEQPIRRALALGERPAFWANLGNVLKDTGRAADAQAAYERALALQPGVAEVWNNLALVHGALGRTDQAEAAYRRALELKPDYAAASYNLAVLLAVAGRVADAERMYRQAIADSPGLAVAHHGLGMLLQEDGRPQEAEASLRRAIALHDTSAGAHCDLGLALHTLGRPDDALACYQRALAIEPGHAKAHYNSGVVHEERRQWAQAVAAYRRALEGEPGFAQARFNLGVMLLMQQRLEEGWPLYEARYDPAQKPVIVLVPRLSIPQWRGEPLAGKSLVIWPEQGFGDYIQFARYAAWLKQQGVTRLTLVSYPPLAPLLETVDGVDAVVTDLPALQRHDYWCLVMSLPLHAGTTAASIPVAPLPYVHPIPGRVSRWRDLLPAAVGLRVGLVWRGSAAHKNDAKRSLPLASLAPLWTVPGVAFVSLQKGQGEEEAATPPQGQPLAALGAAMEDFADAAAIISQLDLVICVDTAIAHLAGAMGKPCWVLLPATRTDWRWGLEGDSSPWYPSIRLFRQRDTESWDATIAQVAAALRHGAAANPG